MSHHETLIIGAGLAGLSCALELHKEGRPFLLLEQSDGPGGRVRTDEVNGFLLDRGFQVFLSAYPEAATILDLPALKLKEFEPGALVFQNQKLHRVMDVFRRPQYALSSLFAPVGNLRDKALVARLRFHLKNSSVEDIMNREDISTADYLRKLGFSEGMIQGFFGSFYGGIFLENELRTSSRMFEFTFKMFSTGAATLPEKGMEEIPKQIANRLPQENIRYGCRPTTVDKTTVTLRDGETLTADAIILAVPADAANTLVPELNLPSPAWRSVTNLYFSAPKSPLQEAIIALNGEGTGLVNNVSVLSNVSTHYAPANQSLISVSLLGLPERQDLIAEVQAELAKWFGEQTKAWQHLRTDRIPKALPEQLPKAESSPLAQPPLYLCGDYLTSASIEGALISGRQAARERLKSLS